MRLALSRHLRKWTYALVGREISRITRYADRVVHVDPLPSDTGMLLDAIDAPRKETAESGSLGAITRDPDAVDVILFNGNFNHSTDVQGLLEIVRPHLGRRGRVVVALYNSYFAWLFRLADRLGLRQGPPIVTFITQADLQQLARLGGFDVVRLRPVAYVPWHFFGLGSLLNVAMPAVPGLRWLSLVTVAVLRPVIASDRDRPSLSIVIPARNERGNIEDALRRMPDFGAPTEVIFVEGHSSDGTWEEIQRVMPLWDGRNALRVRAFQQVGKGKADAVRLGFSKATGDVLTILDADLTMPPEKLTRFFDAYCKGAADFVNGTRLVYPDGRRGDAISQQAWQRVLRQAAELRARRPVWATALCGTKLRVAARLRAVRAVAERLRRLRSVRGLRAALSGCRTGTGIIDIPVYYRARTYGTTNIRRFRDGAILFRMSMTGLLRIKFGSLR